MGNSLTFDDALERRRDAARDYIETLYRHKTTGGVHDQWHHIGKHHEERPLHAFAGTGGVVQAWDLNGIGVVTANQLASPIAPADGAMLDRSGFARKQVKDAELVASKLSAQALDGTTYALGVAHCVAYEPVCYIHNNLLRYNALTAHQSKYDARKMTSISAGGLQGDNSINKHNLLNLVRPLVGGRILSKNVRVGFELPSLPLPLPSWTIDEFLSGSRFMTIPELRAAHPDHFVMLSEDNITVEYQIHTDETLITLPYLFGVERTELKRMVVVPTETGRQSERRGAALLKAGKAVEAARTRR